MRPRDVRAIPAYIGVDLGGTNTRLALVAEGVVHNYLRFATEAQAGPAYLLHRLAGAVRELAGRAQSLGFPPVAGLGVACPGVLDRAAGGVRFSPNLPGWRDIPLVDQLQSQTKLAVALENDANLYALGEHRFGAGRGYDDQACLTLGTGVGGGLILGGSLVVGPLGCGGELGHTLVEPLGRRCGCGARGCLEAYASATGLAAGLKEALAGGEVSALKPGDDPARMARAAGAGDALALHLFAQAGQALGRAVAYLAAVTSLDLIILGGGLAAAWPLMESTARHELADRLRLVDPALVRIVLGRLGGKAPLLGAAAWAAEHINQSSRA
jgi:glucokinase